jgi:hypothetical protein
MQKPSARRALYAGLLLLCVATAVAAHGGEHEHGGGMDMGGMDMSAPEDHGAIEAANMTTNGTVDVPINYFRHPEHTWLLFGHIILMAIAWIFVLPIGTDIGVAPI